MATGNTSRRARCAGEAPHADDDRELHVARGPGVDGPHARGSRMAATRSRCWRFRGSPHGAEAHAAVVAVEAAQASADRRGDGERAGHPHPHRCRSGGVASFGGGASAGAPDIDAKSMSAMHPTRDATTSRAAGAATRLRTERRCLMPRKPSRRRPYFERGREHAGFQSVQAVFNSRSTWCSWRPSAPPRPAGVETTPRKLCRATVVRS